MAEPTLTERRLSAGKASAPTVERHLANLQRYQEQIQEDWRAENAGTLEGF